MRPRLAYLFLLSLFACAANLALPEDEHSTAGCSAGQIYLQSVNGCVSSCQTDGDCGSDVCSKPDACYPDPRCPPAPGATCIYACVGVCQAPTRCVDASDCPVIECVAAPGCCPENQCVAERCTLVQQLCPAS